MFFINLNELCDDKVVSVTKNENSSVVYSSLNLISDE